MEKLKFADLFAGIGGFRLGLNRLGWQCVYSAENDEHACDMYKANYGVNPYQDITSLTDKDIEKIPDFDVLCAGFPCQSFSISGKKRGFLDQTRGTLFFYILKFLLIKKPKAFILENVKYLTYHDKGKTLSVMINSLNDMGYTVSYKILNAKDFGVPQNRERVVIVGNNEGKPFNFNNIKTKPVHSMLPFLDDKGDFEYLDRKDYTIIPKEYIKRQTSDLIFTGYLKGSIRKVGVREGTLYLSRVHRMPRRIYSSLGVHPTLSSQESSGRYWIKVDDKVRKLTMNEAFRFMGFPPDFKKVGSKSKLYNRIGNSVCVNMVTSVGRELENTLNGKIDKNSPEVFLENVYKEANNNGERYFNKLSGFDQNLVEIIVNHDHSLKGVYTALVTSLVYKCLHPDQDIRYHQSSMKDSNGNKIGYSGRAFDTQYVTPFLNQHRFNAAMKESGWLTRSIEQPVPFTMSFPGKINNRGVKEAFLTILDYVQNRDDSPKNLLISLLYKSIKKAAKDNVDIINPVKSESNLDIDQIMKLLQEHFDYKNYANGEKGNSILPVLAVYSIYQVITKEMDRYKGKKLLPLSSHYSSDSNSGLTGDVVVAGPNDKPNGSKEERDIYEAVEVKYNKPETPYMIQYSFDKFKSLGTMQRYYILSTLGPSDKDKFKMEQMQKNIYENYGTQVIVNGLMRTIRYYLRLISNTNDFIDNYTNNLKNSSELNSEHKVAWNRIVQAYLKGKNAN